MFNNKYALETLVRGDKTATDEEKSSVLSAINGSINTFNTYHTSPVDARERAVVSYDEAARILGFKSKHAVYGAVRRGVLKGCSCGTLNRRSYGITMDSIRKVLGR